METLWQVLARDRRSDAIACRLGDDARVYDYDRFLTTAWQAGNYLRHLGVREGVVVGIADDRIPETLLAALGGGLLGATAWFDPPLGADLRAMIAPAGEIEAYDGDTGRGLVAYGGSVETPSIERFEEGLWSENPTMPPERPGSGATMLTDGNRSYSQGRLLEAAARFEDKEGIEAGTDVVVAGSLADPGVIVGVLAALRASATVVLADDGAGGSDLAIRDGSESRAVDPADLVR